MAKIVDLQHKWATEIGRMFVAFGSIESISYVCLKAFSLDPIFSHLSRMRFSTRIDVIIDLVKSKDLSEANKQNFIENLKLAKVLARQRNLIAHNPLVLQLYDKQTGQNVFREIILSSKDDQKFIGFDELVLVARQSEDLSSNLHKNLANFRSEGIDT